MNAAQDHDRVDAIQAQWQAVCPSLDTAAMGVIARLSRLSRMIDHRLAKVFAQYGLQPGEFDLLATLRRCDQPDGLPAGSLTQQSMVSAGTTTHRLDRLVAKGLVTREVDPTSRRSTLIGLTSRGRRLIDEAMPAHLANEEELLAGISTRSQQQLAALLREWSLALGDAEVAESPN